MIVDAGDPPAGRDAALDELFRVHGAPLLQLAGLLTGDGDAALEAVLGAFVELRSRGHLRDGPAVVEALLAAVVRRCRAAEPRGGGGAEPPDVLAALTPRQREAVVLDWWLGGSVPEVARLLRTSRRAVRGALGQARESLPAEEVLGRQLEARAATFALPYDAVDELHERLAAARHRRRRRSLALGGAAVLVLGAVAGIVVATRPRAYVSPSGRPVFAAVVPVADLATFDVRTGRPRGSASLSRVAAVASLPAGGWLASRIQSGCGSTLATVRPDGTSTPLGGTLPDLLSDIQVGPGGRYVAGVASLCLHTRVLGIDLVDLRSGRVVRTWQPPAGTTTISGLSWAPDGRRLAYTLGSGVAGRGSGYALLDTRRPGGPLEDARRAARRVLVGGRGCAVVRSLWLGGTGRFAVFATCPGSADLLLVRVPPGPAAVPRGDVLASLPGSAGTLALDAATTSDGRHVLVTTDVATFRIDGSSVTRLVDARPSPAW